MMLVGEGALRFAKDYGYKEEDLLTERSRMAWLAWKREMRDSNGHTNWESGVSGPPKSDKRAELKKLFPHADDELIAWAFDSAEPERRTDSSKVSVALESSSAMALAVAASASISSLVAVAARTVPAVPQYPTGSDA